MNGIGVILLAAGASRRMGFPKQLVEIDGVALIRRACEKLLTLRPEVLCVVLGAEAASIAAALAGLQVEIVLNLCWDEGLGTSISRGMEHCRARALSGILIALCDQPAVPESHYASLCARLDPASADIVATEYSGVPGVPAVFASSMFEKLMTLKGDRGAKSLMLDPERRVIRIPSEAAAIDLDTIADVEKYRSLR